MRYTYEQIKDIIDRELAKEEYVQRPEMLFEPLSYMISDGGKRLRPVLMLMAYNMYKDNIMEIIDSAVGIELFHNYTLLHDDLMDDSDVRRGKPTVHKKWNANVAILSGDAAAIKSYQYVTSCEDKYIKDVIRMFNETALDVCRGQQYDMEFETRKTVSEKEYIEMIYLKTSVLIAECLRHGALLAGVSKDEYDTLYKLGGFMGNAFQIQDDFLDVYGKFADFGKAIGRDIIVNKKTYLFVKAFELGTEKDKKELDYWFGLEDFVAQEKIDAVTNIYNRLGLKETTINTINDYINESLKILDGIEVDRDKKENFYEMIEALKNRQS